MRRALIGAAAVVLALVGLAGCGDPDDDGDGGGGGLYSAVAPLTPG